MNVKSKRWAVSLLITIAVILGVLAGFVAYVDPYFHYHGPVDTIEYLLDNERYQNDGIVKHFEYDAIICGSSMTECFKTSEMDEIFGTHSIKVPFSGGSYKEVNDLLNVAAKHNDRITTIVRCLDYNRLFDDKDFMDYEDYPEYLYDKNPFNDVKYLFNMTVLMRAVQNVLGVDANGPIKTSFDKYANWMFKEPCSRDAVNAKYNRATLEYAGMQYDITAEEYSMLDANIQQNVVDFALAHPEIDIYLYFSPYNIYYMDFFYQNGNMKRQLLAERYVIEKLLPIENIHLYSFFDNHELMWNLDLYKDIGHHSEVVNTEILRWIKNGTGLLTVDNYEAYCNAEYDYFMNLDYDAMYAQLSERDDVVLNH